MTDELYNAEDGRLDQIQRDIDGRHASGERTRNVTGGQ